MFFVKFIFKDAVRLSNKCVCLYLIIGVIILICIHTLFKTFSETNMFLLLKGNGLSTIKKAFKDSNPPTKKGSFKQYFFLKTQSGIFRLLL